jgi:hypothetical protein
MLMIEYLNSVDPLLRVLRSRPEEVFGRRYAGYLIFLFGVSDEEFATWFTKNLISLDSLTGPHVAGAVFAKRIKLAVKGAGMRGREVSLGQVHYTGSRLVRDDYSPRWSGATSELTAVTYAADEVATAFGVLRDRAS